MKRIIYIILGTISLILGGIGIFIPVLPTTPFLLLTSWFYIRSSRRLYEWLINHRVCGLYIRSYIKYKGVSKRYKIGAIFLLWFTMLISISIVEKSFVKVILALIGIGVTTHILLLKTLTKEQIIELEKFEEEHRKQVEENISIHEY